MTSVKTAQEETRSRTGLLFFRSLGLVALSAVLFALSFPNPLVADGLGFLAFFCLVPVFYLLPGLTLPRALLWGLVHGLLSYTLLNFWLGTYHPLALLFVLSWMGLLSAGLFFVLAWTARLFPRAPYWAWTVVWVAWEFLRTQGFLGYSWGILGYAQWQFLPLLQNASWGGVFVLSTLTVFPAAWLGCFLRRPQEPTLIWSGAAFLAALGLSLVYGWFQLDLLAKESGKTWRPALIQHNSDPWKGGYSAYQSGLESLKKWSQEALKDRPQALIWSETAFVPSVLWHQKYRDNADYYYLVRNLTDYLADQSLPVVFGNDHGELVSRGGRDQRVDYNAAFVWSGGQLLPPYKKVKLVPFTEYFPYRETLPWVYDWLKAVDTHFWEPGSSFDVFTLDQVKIGLPICFEDGFGDLCREFVRGGAQVLVNLTNDNWSGSETALRQHLVFSVLRAAENQRSVVRSANGGMTAAIDPSGRLLGTLPVFTGGYLVPEVPVREAPFSLYTEWGDVWAWSLLILAVLSLAGGSARFVIISRMKVDNLPNV